MVLQSRDGRKRFEVMDQNWHFVMGLLSYDVTTNSTNILNGKYSTIEPYESIEISSTIRSIMLKHTIYEFWDGIKLEPLINPSSKLLKKLGGKAQLLTEKRRSFLDRFCKFLENSSDLDIVS